MMKRFPQVHSRKPAEPNSEKNCEKVPSLNALTICKQFLKGIFNMILDYGCSRLIINDKQKKEKRKFLKSFQRG